MSAGPTALLISSSRMPIGKATFRVTGARWAARKGAGRLYLQVEDGNDAALRLYTRAGFTRSHGYHYRIGS